MEFSVVIPLFNKEDYIARAIESVLTQSHKEFELIIVDDGSTDSSIDVVKKFKDKRIRLIQQSNAGVSVARNKGIDLSNNKYICFLDADDAWKANFLETINSLIEEYPNAGAYATAYEFVTESLESKLPKNIMKIEKNWKGIIEDYFKHSLKGPLISASSVVIPKNVFEEIGEFSAGINRGEDLEMWTRIALKYNIVFINKICVKYYRNIKNSATNKNAILEESFAKDAEKVLIKGRTEKNYSLYFEEYMIRHIIRKARYCIEENNKREARRLLYKYKYTKYNKDILLKTYLMCWLPKSFINMVSSR